MIMLLNIIIFVISFELSRGQHYDTFTGDEISRARFAELERAGLVPWCAIEIAPCNPKEPRRMDNTCNNLQRPSRGAPLTPYNRLLPSIFAADGGLRTAKSGRPLPNARSLRVALIPDGRIASPKYTQLVTNLNVFIVGDVSSVHDTVTYVAAAISCCTPAGRSDPRCMAIDVAADDVHLRRSNIRCLNLTRATTYQRLGCVSRTVPAERINTAAPMAEMSILYGHNSIGAMRSRELAGGRLRSELLRGREWPPSGTPYCVNNNPPQETRCHDSAVSGANALLGINVIFLWLYRAHNAIARRLQEINPCWDDDKLFYTAKEINIAMYQQIIFYEMMPLLLGEDFLIKNKAIYNTAGHIEDYDPGLDPGTSIEYITGVRWFHTIQEGRLNLYTKDGRLYQQLAIVDFILRTGALPLNRTLEGITQGTFRQPCADVGSFVDPDIGERILGRLQLASDGITSDIMKGRDAGLPPYNEYRKLCGLPVVKKFIDLLPWIKREQVEALALAYEDVDDIDLMAGIIAELPMPGVVVGPTLGCIMVNQMLRWRRADRFWYENSAHPGAFTQDQLLQIKKASMSGLICNFGDEVSHIQPNAFLLPGPGNEMVECSTLALPDITSWKDGSCGIMKPNLTTKYDYANKLSHIFYK